MQPRGRRTPTNFDHVERYPPTLTTTPSAPVPVVIGVDWFTNFDNPVKDSTGGRWSRRADILRLEGHKPWGGTGEVKLAEGISANRWATSVGQVMDALKSPASERMGAVRVLNSWGRSYPHRVWMPFETLQILLDRDGEA